MHAGAHPTRRRHVSQVPEGVQTDELVGRGVADCRRSAEVPGLSDRRAAMGRE